MVEYNIPRNKFIWKFILYYSRYKGCEISEYWCRVATLFLSNIFLIVHIASLELLFKKKQASIKYVYKKTRSEIIAIEFFLLSDHRRGNHKGKKRISTWKNQGIYVYISMNKEQRSSRSWILLGRARRTIASFFVVRLSNSRSLGPISCLTRVPGFHGYGGAVI